MEISPKPVQQADPSRELEVKKKRLRDSCLEFESVMISYMMKTMHDGVRWGEEPDTAKAVYEDMLTGQVAKEISRSSVLGVGDMLYSKLEPLLETQVPQKPKKTGAGVQALNSLPSANKPETGQRIYRKSVYGCQRSDLLNRSKNSAD